MERSEPSLIPEWLKASGSTSGGGTTSHQRASSSLHSDDRVASKPSRNKSSISTYGHDTGRSSVSDRTTSAYFRRSSSSSVSSHLRSNGSFGRSNRDKDWEKEIYDFRGKQKSILDDHIRCDDSDPLENILRSRFEKDLRRSQSMTSGKQGETWLRKVPSDLSNANQSNHNNNNVSRVHKAAFERDFPSLGAEERQAAPEIGRVSSPIQSLPIGTTAVGRGDGWTSALAEVPVLVGSNGSAGSVQQSIPPTSASLASSPVTGMNMAETLVQGPPRAPTIPQLSVETQKLEELAIKQSRQLIPMTPSMPKALVPNPSEKPKLKLGQLHLNSNVSSPHPSNHSPRNGSVKSDISRMSSVGKLHVLKPVRERNGVSPTTKDSSSPTSVSRVTSSLFAVAPSVVGSAPLRAPSNNPNLAGTLEKKPTPQSQSRNDFFNLMRKKSTTNPSSPLTSPGLAMSSSVSDKSGETENGSAPNSSFGDRTSEKDNDVKSNGIALNKARESLNVEHGEHLNCGKDHSIYNAVLCSEEEEAAFLRSLGWEENAEEEEGLTQEEISSFYKGFDEYIKLKPSSKLLQGMQPKFLVSLNLREGSVGADASSGSSSSDAELES